MLIHTCLISNSFGKPVRITVRLAAVDIFIRKSIKRERKGYSVIYAPELTELENHIAAMRKFCSITGITGWFVHTQESSNVYRFTETTADCMVHIPPVVTGLSTPT